MKKTVAVILLLITISVILVGCTSINNLPDTITKFKSKGFSVTSSYVEPKDLERATSFTNDEIKSLGGSFKVQVAEQYSLLSQTNPSESCIFIVFDTTSQARKYANIKASRFDELRKESGYFESGSGGNLVGDPPKNTLKWKVARNGRLVVITNSDVAMDMLNLYFR